MTDDTRAGLPLTCGTALTLVQAICGRWVEKGTTFVS